MPLTDRLMDNVRISCPGAVDSLIATELWNVVDDLCRDGWVWREIIEVPLSIGDATYTPAPAGTEIVHILTIQHDTMSVQDATFQFGTLALAAAPVASDVVTPLYVEAVLTPSLSAGADIENLIPADMWSKYHAVLLEGLLGRMFAQPAKPYTNPTLAMPHLKNYRSMKSQARHEARGAQPFRFPRWV